MSTKEAIDLGGSSRRRRGSAPKAGSVWESRMKFDQVKGGFKVFNATLENPDQNPTQITTISPTTVNNPEIQMDTKADNARPKQGLTGVSGKRKTWKSDNSDGSPVQIARKRSDSSKNLDEQSKELGVSGDGIGIKKSPVLIKKTGSVSSSSDGNEIQLRKVKSEPSDGELKAKTGVGIRIVYENVKNCVPDEPNKGIEGSIGGNGETLIIGGRKLRSDDGFGLCEDKSITSNVGRVNIPPSDDDDDDFADDDDDDREIEVEKKSLDIKEITVLKKSVIEEKKQIVHPAVNHATFHPTPTKTKSTSDDFYGTPRTNSKLQSFVDLVMWKDSSKSAFVFGIGTFAIISSSYTKDLSISFISVVSYLGLVYLAAIFIFRSLINRGSNEMDSADKDCVVGEEEAIWVVKLLLPYLNEFLLKLKALFSGDPATTMKLAVLLYILARCGSSITVWKMAKLGFIGVFTVPKVCSTYSSQLTAYGTFWIRRFGDAWESCSHKKAVGFAIFTLVWNLSSVVARIWAVFMLFVAFKYYQQSLITREEWAHEEQTMEECRSTTLAELRKQRKCIDG